MTVMAMATLSILGAMLSLYFNFHDGSVRAPKWLRCIAFKWFARVFFLRKEVPIEEGFELATDIPRHQMGSRPEKYSLNLDVISGNSSAFIEFENQ